jgi:hypothetical protein
METAKKRPIGHPPGLSMAHTQVKVGTQMILSLSCPFHYLSHLEGPWHESSWESLNALYMTISSDDNAIFEYLLPTHKSSFSTDSTQQIEKKSAKHVQEKRTVTQKAELLESDLETDPETCGKCRIVYL